MKSIIFLIVALFAGSVFAEESEVLKNVLAFAAPYVGVVVKKYPFLGDVLNIMVMARLIVKPLMSAFLTIKSDVPFFNFSEKVLNHKAYKTFAFVADWVLSLKLPKAKK